MYPEVVEHGRSDGGLDVGVRAARLFADDRDASVVDRVRDEDGDDLGVLFRRRTEGL